MLLDRDLLRGLLYRWGWDTGCRNRAAARILKPAIRELGAAPSRPLLDVGCGDAGVAVFLDAVPVVGLDLSEPTKTPTNLTFVAGSITDLPFSDHSFDFASCIDVLENLPPAAREQAVAELLRVARHGVVIACPHGEAAARCDEEFRLRLARWGRPVPAWLEQHGAYAFPTVDGLVDSVSAVDRNARVTISFSEPTAVCRVIRVAAARSNLLYAATNLLFGLLMPIIPKAQPNASYRVIVFAQTASEP